MNVSKTKIMCFMNKRCEIEYKWKINEEIIEKVEEFSYLGFWFEAGDGMRKRRFKKDWRMKVWMFVVLV